MPGRERELVAEPNLPGELQPGGLQPSARVGTAPLINVPPVKAAPLTGQDVFTDLQARMEQQRIKESGEVDIQGRPLPRQMTAEAIKEEMRLRQGTPGQTNEERMVERGAPTPGAASPVEVTPDKRLLLHSLAGLMQDDFNTRMALGQQNLKAGRYEDAVTHFQIAVSINPDNPLAKVALALAMFSAGQPLNGATQLKRAMIAYPPLMKTRLDLPAMINTKDLKSHLSFLDARLNTPKTAKEPDLYFITAYLYWNLDMKDQARDYALKLKSSPDITTTMTNFAAMVLKDVGPVTAPASQPAPTAP